MHMRVWYSCGLDCRVILNNVNKHSATYILVAFESVKGMGTTEISDEALI